MLRFGGDALTPAALGVNAVLAITAGIVACLARRPRVPAIGGRAVGTS